jgi:ribosomal protein S18 acetylase RimI-like enzyme
VYPSHFRKGIANALLAFLLEEKQGIEKAIVSTGGQNIPTKNLYVKHGFIETRQIPITEGIYLSVLEK